MSFSRIFFTVLYRIHNSRFWEKSRFAQTRIVPLYVEWYHTMFARQFRGKTEIVNLSCEEQKKFHNTVMKLPLLERVTYKEKYQEFTFHCPLCDRDLEIRAKASLREFGVDREVVEVVGFGLCFDCNLHTNIFLRWYPDSGDITLYERNGLIREFTNA